MRSLNTVIALMALSGASQALALRGGTQASLSTNQYEYNYDTFNAACNGDQNSEYYGLLFELAYLNDWTLDRLCVNIYYDVSEGSSLDEAINWYLAETPGFWD